VIAIGAILGAATLVVSALAPVSGPSVAGPDVLDSALLLWVAAALFALNAAVAVPAAWVAHLRSRSPKTYCVGLNLVVSPALAVGLAIAVSAEGNRIQTLALAFLFFASATAGMAAINLYLLARHSAHAV
jgi:hypothetical protein